MQANESKRQVIFGCNGPVGVALMERLAGRGIEVVGVCGSDHSEAPAGVTIAELKGMMYQWERPFVVDHRKFGDRFWSDATPWEEGLGATVEWYRAVGTRP